MTLRGDLAFVREAYLNDITWANPAQAERDFDDLIRKIRAEAVLEMVRLAALSMSFWLHVDSGDRDCCWMWEGSRRGENDLYGGFDGTTAHRYSWALHNGGYPVKEVVVRHRCDTPLCVRPDHLERGSQEENVADMIERGRAFWQTAECSAGHPKRIENIYVSPSGKRECKECRRLRLDARQERDRANLFTCHCGKTMQAKNKRRHLLSTSHKNPYGEEQA